MTPATRADSADGSADDAIHRVRIEFEKAWQQAARGGEQPDLETYLADNIDTDQTVLRRELELIDRMYRQGLASQRAATLDFTPPAIRPDTSQSSHDETVHLPVPPAPEPTPEHTIDIERVQAGDDPPESSFELAPATPFANLPGYEILGELGRGAMGIVYKARQLRLDRIVALKMLRVGISDNPAFLARFRTESQAEAQLLHPNIVQIYEVGEADGLHYFSLEYVEGGDLANKTAGQPQPIADAARMLFTLAQAMNYAHQQGVIHRDLKPANVLLTVDGTPKIADFGLAKRLEAEESNSQTRTGSLLGTPSYMAPEQARGDLRLAGPPADVYSLGAILYALLTGHPPFCGASVTETILQVLTKEPVPPSRLRPGIPRDLETICLKAMEKELPRRYATAAALAEDLRRFLAGEPILARPIGPVERLWRWARRNPRVAALSAAVASLLVVVAVASTAFAFAFARERDEKENERHAAVDARDLARQRAEDLETARNLADQNAQRANENAKRANENAQRADQNARLANENARLANEQANLALETLSELLVSVRENLKDSPGTQRLRQAFVREAIDKLKRIAPSIERLPLADLSRAEAHRFLGMIYLELGQVKEARPHFEQCRTLLEKLADVPGASQGAQRDLTVAYHVLGDFYLLTGDTAKAHSLYEKALALRQKLRVANPSSELARVDLATSYVKLGNASDPEEALRHYGEALKLRLELEEASPRNAALRRDVWIVCNHIGDVHLRLRTTEAALESYRAGFRRAEQLVEMAPRSAGFKQVLGISHEKLGTALLQSGKPELAREHYTKALALIRPLAKDDPDNLSLQANLVLLLARSGAHAEASALALDLLRLAPQYANNLYNVSCCYALCASAVGGGKRAEQLTAQEKDTRRRYTEASVKLMVEAVKQGFCNLTMLRTDPDLDPIRGDPAFAAVVNSLR